MLNVFCSSLTVGLVVFVIVNYSFYPKADAGIIFLSKRLGYITFSPTPLFLLRIQIHSMSLGLGHITLRKIFLHLWWIFGGILLKLIFYCICPRRMSSFHVIFQFVLIVHVMVLQMHLLQDAYLMNRSWSSGTSLIILLEFLVQIRTSA